MFTHRTTWQAQRDCGRAGDIDHCQANVAAIVDQLAPQRVAKSLHSMRPGDYYHTRRFHRGKAFKTPNSKMRNTANPAMNGARLT